MDDATHHTIAATAAILGPDDPLPFEILNPKSASPLVLHCDHAGTLVPQPLRNLGLTSEVLDKHVAVDIGAAGVTRGLAARLNAVAVLARYSRLVIDANRAWGDPEAVPEVSDERAIPGNRGISIDGVLKRAHAISAPYHQAIDGEIARLRRLGLNPIILSVHSFTPALMNQQFAKPRPWHIGVMFGRDERFARLLVTALRANTGLVVGENQPYSGVTHAYCLKIHGLAQGLPHAQIEVRQDLICTPAGEWWWADLLAAAIRPILENEALKESMHL